MSYIWAHRLGRHLWESQRSRSPAVEIRNSGQAMADVIFKSWGISCRQPTTILELLQTRELRTVFYLEENGEGQSCTGLSGIPQQSMTGFSCSLFTLGLYLISIGKRAGTGTWSF